MAVLNINPDLFLGSHELNRLLKFIDDDGFRKLLLQNSLNFGIVNNSIGGNFTSFKAEQGVNVGYVKINEGLAIDGGGQLITYPETEFEITNDNLWYWITITHQYDYREQGYCSIDGNGNLSFPGGELLSILRGLPNNPVKVKFTNSINNLYEYEIVEVIDDENAVLAGDFSAESNLRLGVVGAFTPDVVPPTASKFPYRYDGCVLSVTLESTLNTPPTLTENYQFTIARIKRNGSALTIQDKRIDIYRTKSDYDLDRTSSNNNPLIGIEAVKFDSNLSPRNKNLVYLAWAFRSSNFTTDSSINRVTLIAGNGGKFKTTSDFTDGDFDGWRIYTEDGSYSIIKQSSLSATQINLILDSLDPDKYTNTSQQLIVAPDADEIELVFTPNPADGIALTDTIVSFHINNGEVIVPLEVYKNTSCSYQVAYRYKAFKKWSQLTQIPADSIGYYVEASFNSSGVLTGSARQTYSTGYTLILQQATNAYSNRIAGVETGDLFGTEYLELDNSSPIVELVVGTDKQYQIITNDDDLDASDSDFGSSYTFTVDHFISLSSLTPTTLQNGNGFILHFRGEYIPDGYNLTITQDYVNSGNTGINLYIFDADDFEAATNDQLLFYCFYDGTRWFVKKILTSGTSGRLRLNRQTASYELVYADRGKMVEMNVGSSNNCTIPPNSTVPFQIGDTILISQYGAGKTTIVAGSGVTLRSDSGILGIVARYAGVVAIKIGTNEWYIQGALG